MDNEKERKRPSTKMVINEEEARIVRLIFNMHCDGKGYKAIVNELNHRGYKTKKGNKSVRIHRGFYPLTEILKCTQCGAGMVISGAPDGNVHACRT